MVTTPVAVNSLQRCGSGHKWYVEYNHKDRKMWLSEAAKDPDN